MAETLSLSRWIGHCATWEYRLQIQASIQRRTKYGRYRVSSYSECQTTPIDFPLCHETAKRMMYIVRSNTVANEWFEFCNITDFRFGDVFMYVHPKFGMNCLHLLQLEYRSRAYNGNYC
jgi:hypothetical protein